MVVLGVAGAADAAAARSRPVASKEVTFTVQNVNRSKLSCGTDGSTYQVKGHLTAPRSTLGRSSRTRRGSVTLYLHGLGFGEWFWTFSGPSLPPAAGGFPKGIRYAEEQAKAGHASVTIDRLGYDASGHPDGNKSCLGGQADIAHQVVQALRSGSYGVGAGRPLRFRRVALAGHSAGAAAANIETYSFRDVDALIGMSFSYSNLPRAQLALGPTRDTCLRGGEPSEPGAPSGYAFFGQPVASDFISIMFRSAPASVTSAAASLRNRDPCGDVASIIPAILQQRAMLKRIKVPVLVICGRSDALYSSLGCSQQEELYTGSRSTTLALVGGAGHALPLERSAASFRRKVSRWLSRRGF